HDNSEKYADKKDFDELHKIVLSSK
ncbi:MAG: hypothetical protein ACJAWV_001480, partial [Flammeovirgaceae bacterium]